MFKKTQRQQQAGISLLEVMLSISVIAFILVMATRFFHVANNGSRINAAISEVGALETAARNWRGANATYDNISINTLYNAGMLDSYPGIQNNGGSAIFKTPWGGQYNITATETGAKISTHIPNCGSLPQAFPGAACQNGNFEYEFS